MRATVENCRWTGKHRVAAKNFAKIVVEKLALRSVL
jgi:hypothetical protein